MMKTALKTLVVACFLVTFAGCASHASQSDVQQAMRKAESAQSTADDAQQTANQALQTANEAKSEADSNQQRMERMFRSSQQK
jgi:hypothetical protein